MDATELKPGPEHARLLDGTEECWAITSTNALLAICEGTVNKEEREQFETHLRDTLRLHRMIIISWLLTNGVALPIHLVADQTHFPLPSPPAVDDSVSSN